jgi:hypothetical protein
MIDFFQCSGNYKLFQTELMSFWIPDSNISVPAGINSSGISSLPGESYFFKFAVAISAVKWLRKLVCLEQ